MKGPVTHFTILASDKDGINKVFLCIRNRSYIKLDTVIKEKKTPTNYIFFF